MSSPILTYERCTTRLESGSRQCSAHVGSLTDNFEAQLGPGPKLCQRFVHNGPELNTTTLATQHSECHIFEDTFHLLVDGMSLLKGAGVLDTTDKLS